MKKYAAFIIACLVMLISTGSVFAQPAPGQRIGPGQPVAPGQPIAPGQIIPGQPIAPGQQIIPGQQFVPGQYGYNLQVVPVVQAWTYAHRTPIVLQGNIVQFYGGRDLYIFRDSSGDILVKIGQKEWLNLWYQEGNLRSMGSVEVQGINIAAADNVEIYGEVHWPRHSYGTPEVHVRFIKKI